MRIGIYPRKSVYRDNSDSVSVQIQMCKDYAKIIFHHESLDFFIYGKDEGFSGKNTNRPSFQELMEDVKNRKLDVLMVYKLDRISRNVQEFSTMYETFQEHGVAFISVKESFDTSTPIGRTVMYILAAFAQLERENTSERVADNMKSLGSTGKWTGGRLPSGMTSIRKKVDGKEHSYLIVDNQNIDRIKLLYDMILNGYSITALERYCRDNGIKSQNGKFLNTSQIYGILTNPVYCQNSPEAYYYFKENGCMLPDVKLFDGKRGLIGYGKTKNGMSQQKQKKEDWTIAIGIHEGVIAADKWIATQRRLGINKQVRTQKYEVGILKGALRCKCGRRMLTRVYQKNGILFSYYFCQARSRYGTDYCDAEFVRTDAIDNLFINKLKDIRINPDFINNKEDFKVINTSDIRKEIKSTETALHNLTAQLQDNVASTAAKYIISQMEALDQKLNVLSNQLREEEFREIHKRTIADERQEVHRNICFLLDNFDAMTYTEKNELIKKSVKNCVLDGKNLNVTF